MKQRISDTSALSRPNFGRTLGPLEARIMDVIWRRGRSAVRDVLNALNAEGAPELAYTTVMTVMGNLAEKGLLLAEQAGRTYLYTPTVSYNEFVRDQVKAVLDSLLDRFTEPTLSYFVERLGESDPAQLAELERRIAEERARQAGEDAAP
jgi:predicted transcriptional regulator